MSAERWAAVDSYLTELLAADPVLEAVLEANAAAGLPPHDVSPLQGKLLEVLARALGAERILEIGTLGGYSAINLARGLAPGGRVVTIESVAAYAETARGNLLRAGLADVVEVRVADAREALAGLAAEGGGPFDLIFIDADKRQNADYLRAALALSRPGTLIVADNVVRRGAVADPADDDPRVQGVRRFNELLASEPGLVATTIQSVGSKGHDGLAFAVVAPGD